MEKKIRTFKHIDSDVGDYYVFCQSRSPPSSEWIECDELEFNELRKSKTWEKDLQWCDNSISYFIFY